MPVKECQLGGRPGYQWGDHGHCYTYAPGNAAAKAAAHKKAQQQGAAAYAAGYKGKEIDMAKLDEERPYPNEHACRLRDPGEFRPNSFRTMGRDHNGKKYLVIMGKLKGQSTMTEQAFHYPKGTWTADAARSHCSSHGGKEFTAATGAKAEAEELKLRILERPLDELELVKREDGKVTGIKLSASSEKPIERWFGTEVLSHDKAAIRLDRASSKAMPLLFNHDWKDPVGMVDSAKVEAKRLMVEAHFFDTPRAQEVARMVEGGLKNVSVGYRVHKFEQDVKAERMTATDWEPYETSIVSVPADASVGVGRDLGGEELVVRMVRTNSTAEIANIEKEHEMSTKEKDVSADGNGAADERIEVIDDSADLAVARERERAKAIMSIAESMQITDRRTVQAWIQGGKPLEILADEMVKVRAERTKAAALEIGGIGLTEDEARRFSFVRAINAVVDNNWTKAGFEGEVSKATAQKMGKMLNQNTFAVPPEVQYLKRTLIAGTGSQGGYTVGTDTQSFIDILRVRSVALRAGVMTMGGLVGQVAIPKKTTAGGVAWIAEAGTATASEMVLGQITLSPKTLAGYQEFTKQLLMQGTPDVETLVQGDLADGIAVKIDNTVLWGTGANTPLGIRYATGLGTANPTAGTAINYADMLRFQSTVATNNALSPGFLYLVTPAIAGLLMGKLRAGTTGDTMCWEGNMLEGMLAGMRAISSNQIGSGCTLAGDFTQAILAQWAGLEVEVNPFANFQAGIIGVKATMFADVAVRQPGAFAIGTGMTG